MTRQLRTEAELREFVDEPHPLIADKAIDHIDPESARFLRASPFFLLATTAPDGSCDVSPRGDPAGSVLLLDDRTLAFGDRKGNRRLDSLRNIVAHPQVGMLFLVPGIGDTLRVNGTARVVVDAPYLDELAVRGVAPTLAVEVRVQELFLHCTKAFRRSSLWDTTTWPDHRGLPSAGQIVRSQSGTAVTAAQIDEALARDAEVNQY
jgi:PPOX class probable FMN-dependent enzyme